MRTSSKLRVHAATGETRVRRMLAVCAAGENPQSRRPARSQIIGAMVMGAGAALMEDLVVDKTPWASSSTTISPDTRCPSMRTSPHQEVIFLEEVRRPTDLADEDARGVGELGICGIGAAVANAIYNATGVRVRDYPITLDKLLSGLPPLHNL